MNSDQKQTAMMVKCMQHDCEQRKESGEIFVALGWVAVLCVGFRCAAHARAYIHHCIAVLCHCIVYCLVQYGNAKILRAPLYHRADCT